MILFCLVLMFLMIFFFYTTPLRSQLEDKLYDIRTLLKPQVNDYQSIAVVEIDEKSVEEFAEGENQDMSFADLERLSRRLLQFEVRSVVVMLYPNIFDYTSDEAEAFAESLSKEKNVYFGVMGIDTLVPSGRQMPEKLKSIEDKSFGLEIFRERRHDFVRRINSYAFRGTKITPLLPLALSREHGRQDQFDDENDFERKFWLNYIDPNLLYRLSARTLLDDDIQPIIRQQLSGRVVFVGYTVFRNRPINSNQIFVNTPWQTEGANPKFGMPLVYVTAMAYVNELYSKWLKESYTAVAVVQCVIVCVFSVLIWTLGISVAIFLFVLSWITILYAHALLFAYANTIVPLADTVLFSALGMLGGSIWRLQVEGRLNLRKEAKTLSLKKLAHEQSSFLLDFTAQLRQMNQPIILRLADLITIKSLEPTHKVLIAKMQASSEDFRDYLKGMSEFASIEGDRQLRAQKKMVNIKEMVQRITYFFEYRRKEQDVGMDLQIPEDFKIHTDENILEAIVFNLISNAIKYTPKGGLVKIVANHDPQSGAFIEVLDEGPGIPEAYHEKIFKKFYRVQDSESHKVKGSGLGLYLSKYLAKRLGVTIAVESNEPQGCVFTVRFK